MPDDELDAVGGELVGDRDALLGIGDVVAEGQGDLLPVDAALRVNVLDRLFGAVLELGAERGVRAGDRPGNAEFDLRLRRARKRQTEAERKSERGQLSHEASP